MFTALERPGPASAVRTDWVDAARGVGIVLVVLGHVWRGLEAAGLIPDVAAFLTLDRLIYAFHMPLFFLLAGLFFAPALEGRPPGVFLWQRVLRLLYPLVLWTYVFALCKVAAGDLGNRPEAAAALLQWPLPPRWHFWFLWALFLIQAGCLVLRPLLDRAGRRGGTAIWSAALALAALLFLSGGGGSPWVSGAIYGAPFFLLGALIGRVRPADLPRIPALPALAVFCLAEWAALRLGQDRVATLVLATLASLSLVTAIRARAPAGGAWLRLSATLGRASMAIFLAHVIFAAATRILLLAAGVEDLAVHLVLGTLAGLAVPFALDRAARAAGWARAVGF